MNQPPVRTRIGRERDVFIGPYKDYLIHRWNEGCRSAQQMYREIVEQGYTGSNTAIGRFVAPLRATKGKARSFKSVEASPETMVKAEEVKQKRPPTALQVVHWITFKEEQRLEWPKTCLEQLCQTDRQIAQRCFPFGSYSRALTLSNHSQALLTGLDKLDLDQVYRVECLNQ